MNSLRCSISIRRAAYLVSKFFFFERDIRAVMFNFKTLELNTLVRKSVTNAHESEHHDETKCE